MIIVIGHFSLPANFKYKIIETGIEYEKPNSQMEIKKPIVHRRMLMVLLCTTSGATSAATSQAARAPLGFSFPQRSLLS